MSGSSFFKKVICLSPQEIRATTVGPIVTDWDGGLAASRAATTDLRSAVFFRGLPEAEWSPELNAKLLEIAQTKVAMYDAYSSEMEQTAADETYLQQHRRSFDSRPIRVLTSGNHGVGHLEKKPPDTPKHLKYEQETTLARALARTVFEL